MNKKNIDEIEYILRNTQNKFPIPLQNIIVEDINTISKYLPKVKLIEMDNFKTITYSIQAFYKPICQIFTLKSTSK